ncbi:MAG: LSM domain-containing protein [Candidatus Nanoarchaeia archaeon]
MTNSIERPLDLLNDAKGKRVLVETKAKKQIIGTLKAFDIHINVVLGDAEERNEEGQITRKIGDVFIRGDMIVLVAPAS